QGMGRRARPARYVARLRGRAGGPRDPRHRCAQSRRGSARRRRWPARLVGLTSRVGTGTGSTNSPREVARAIVSAIEHDRAEVTVARGSVRAGAALGTIAPRLVGAFARSAGAGQAPA